MAFDTACQLKIEQHCGHGTARQVAPARQFVNRDRNGTERRKQAVFGLGPVLA